MKKIIEGRTYNTETATLIESVSGGFKGDMNYWTERLYQTRGGAFFLAGSGGAMSRWCSRLDGGMRGPGDGLLPLTEDEARAWLEGHADAATYARVFGEPAEAGEPASYALRMAPDLKRRAEAAASAAGCSLNAWICGLIETATA